HNLIICLTAPVTLRDSHTDRLAAQGRVHEVHYQEGVAFLWNVCAVLIFQLVLRLIGTEMHHAFTDPAQARIVFSTRGSMCSGCAWVVQCCNKNEHDRACPCQLPYHIMPDPLSLEPCDNPLLRVAMHPTA